MSLKLPGNFKLLWQLLKPRNLLVLLSNGMKVEKLVLNQLMLMLWELKQQANKLLLLLVEVLKP